MTDTPSSNTPSPVKLTDRIYVAGHRSMVGSALVRRLQAGSYANVVARAELDPVAINAFLAENKPDYIVIAAAKVGDIQANHTLGADFLYENLMIEADLIRDAHLAGMQRLMFLGSSCISACNAILFNHESPLRGEAFVTREIARAIARIALRLQDCLYLGNLSALRDWGHARDYVQMQWLMLQQEQAEDFIIANSVQYSVRQFVEFAARELGITLTFSGEGEREIVTIAKVDGNKANSKVVYVRLRVDPRYYYRPTEVETLLGYPSKARASSVGRRWPSWSARWFRATTLRPNATAWSNKQGSKPMATTSSAAQSWRKICRSAK